MCKGVTDPVAAMLGQSQSLDLGALLGHCGATSYGVSDCKGGSQGSLGLDIRHGPSSVILHRAARRCLERCVLCCTPSPASDCWHGRGHHG